jgi:fatty-acyl-CoA synthase
MIHGDVLGERARLTPEKLALVDVATGARLSYGALDARASACARALREGLGLRHGDRLGLLAHNRLEFLDIVFAAAKAGIVLVPIGTRLTPHEVQHIVSDSGLRALVYDGAFGDVVAGLDAAGDMLEERPAPSPRDDVGPFAPPGEPRSDVDASAPSTPGRGAPGIQQCVALDEPVRPTHARYEDLLAAHGEGPFARARCAPDDLFALLYTSGTTGKPKGVMVPHRMVAWNGYNTVACWQLRDDDVSPIFTPLYHAGALGAFLLPIITIGGTIVLHRGFDPGEVWHTIVAERCTVVLGVPTVWKLLMDAPEFATADLSHVRWFISGGAPLPEYIAAAYQARGVVFKQGYGLTEVGVNCFSMTVEESVRKRGSIGKPLMMTEARLLDERGAAVPDGEVGELLLRGPHVSLGYWNNPEATAAALDADGWFHTGDLARRDTEGFFTIAGRRKDMFISGGVNVYPAEIEGELVLHPDVADAAVIGVPHPTWGEVGVAFVVRKPGTTVDGDTLTVHLSGRLAKYKWPKQYVFVDALPRSAYGKVQKPQLHQQWTALATERDRGPEGPAALKIETDPGERDGATRLSRPGSLGSSAPAVLTHAVEGDGPPLVLLNGGMMSLRAWDPIVPRLATRSRVVRCDFRGQLLSPATPPPDLAGHAADLLALLDRLGIECAHLVGTSFGALVALVAAAHAPSRVRSVVAMTATDHIPAEQEAGLIEVMRLSEEAMSDGSGGRIFDALAPFTFSAEYRRQHPEVIATRRQAFGLLPATWYAGLRGLLAALSGADLRPLLPRITCPVLVLAAECDLTFPLERSLALAAGLPKSRLEVVPGAAHGMAVEQPDEVASRVERFVTDLEEGP